jgi:hypothetical protein
MNSITVEGVCEYCHKKFTYERKINSNGRWLRYKKKYCCRSHQAFGGWRVKAVRKPQGRFKINATDLISMYVEGDLSIPDIAKKYEVHPCTVYRRLQELNIHNTTGARRIFAPLDKTVFVLCVSPLQAMYLQIDLKVFMKDRRIPYSLKIYDTTYRHQEQNLPTMGYNQN